MSLTVQEIQKLFPKNTITLSPETKLPRFCQDTRKLKPGDVYVAIPGPRFDGHDFVEEAFAKGAGLALVSQTTLKWENLVCCENTVQAIGTLASLYRNRFSGPVIAITGSSGKTTTKDLIIHVLKNFGSVAGTSGNLNNHIGVPLTLLGFSEEAHFFVIELGMSAPGEISRLAKMVRPDIGLITNIGRAHLQYFPKGEEDVAKAKGELFAGLTKNDIAVINLDDDWIQKLPTSAKKITFGLNQKTGICAENFSFSENGSSFDLKVEEKTFPVKLKMVGKHHISNALAAFATVSALGLESEKIIRGLESFSVEKNRGRLLRHKNLIIMDDTYNANPDSMMAAFSSLQLLCPHQKKIAVVGEMLELGNDSEKLHKEVGEKACALGFSEIFSYGAMGKFYQKGFGKAAPHRHFDDHKKMAKEILELAKENRGELALLIKGSRGTTMEKVLEEILKN